MYTAILTLLEAISELLRDPTMANALKEKSELLSSLARATKCKSPILLSLARQMQRKIWQLPETAFSNNLDENALGRLEARSAIELNTFSLSRNGDSNTRSREKISAGDLILLNSTRRNIEKFLQTFEMSLAILIRGPSGCGKTSIIKEMARVHNAKVVVLHLADASDAKALLGSYVATPLDAGFKWLPGPLTQAVADGCWIVMEDVDRITEEVAAILLPLLECGELCIPERGEKIVAPRSLRIIGTTRIASDTSTRNLWMRINFEAMTEGELEKILSVKFSSLGALLALIMQAYCACREFFSQRKIQSASFQSDVFRLCRRLVGLFANVPDSLKFDMNTTKFSSQLREDIFIEVITVFCNFMPWNDVKLILCTSLASIFDISAQRTRIFFEQYAPTIGVQDGGQIQIGNVVFRDGPNLPAEARDLTFSRYALTNSSRRLLASLASAYSMNESVLLVGETGTGKTTAISHLAKLVGRQLVVLNLSQGCEISDLLGSYKTTYIGIIAQELLSSFEELFGATFPTKMDGKYIFQVRQAMSKRAWDRFARLIIGAVNMGLDKTRRQDESTKKVSLTNLHERWSQLNGRVTAFHASVLRDGNSAVSFNFIEGPLPKALQEGHWILLDEINLAPPETLAVLSALLEDFSSSITLYERGDVQPVPRHRDFRLFAAMNPATDVGKKNLPVALRSRFTEIYVDSLDSIKEDLVTIVRSQLHGFETADRHLVADIVEAYQQCKSLAKAFHITDGGNRKLYFSLRTLSIILLFITRFGRRYGIRRATFEAFEMVISAQLEPMSAQKVHKVLSDVLLDKGNMRINFQQGCPLPADAGENYVQIGSYWLRRGNLPLPSESEAIASRVSRFVITPAVQKTLNMIARAVMAENHPILLQGPTSAGKTSIVEHIAALIGRKCLRVNNHEHTDIQEYIGSYVASTAENGLLAFHDGLLVQALRNGYWIILDELNLAPSDVLEALNRLLDDNRELFIPETGETIHPPQGSCCLPRKIRRVFTEAENIFRVHSDLGSLNCTSAIFPRVNWQRFSKGAAKSRLHMQSCSLKHMFNSESNEKRQISLTARMDTSLCATSSAGHQDRVYRIKTWHIMGTLFSASDAGNPRKPTK